MVGRLQIGDLLQLDDGTHCKEASALAEHKLTDVREKLEDLGRMENVLSQLVQACGRHKGSISCPLIDTLQEGALRIKE